MTTLIAITQALISVSDKTHLTEFCHELSLYHNINLLASSNTAAHLRQSELSITDIAAYTGFPEILDGRVKTLHPKIHAGILARGECDQLSLQQHAIAPIELIVVNLYPFKQVASSNADLATIIENIDIGGPTLIRAAAKNFQHVAVIVDPADYSLIIAELRQFNGIGLTTRRYLAAKAFAHIADYDAAIANYFHCQVLEQTLPDHYFLSLTKQQDLRYGENPHQAAALYQNLITPAQLTFTQLQGKELSYNNLVDSDAAYQCIQSFSQPSCVIVKHANPCGVAQAEDLLTAYQRAYSVDPTSAFGGIIAFNQTLDALTAEYIITQQFVEIIIAPTVTEHALQIIATKPAVRILIYQARPHPQPSLEPKQLAQGMVIQQQDKLLTPPNMICVTARQASAREVSDCLFAWQNVKWVKSNAIVIAKDGMTLGIGAGQCNRVISTKIAIENARNVGFDLHQAVLASDAFFPFADTIELAAAAGITAIIQPGGSLRDKEVIASADKANITMIVTGQRHFRH